MTNMYKDWRIDLATLLAQDTKLEYIEGFIEQIIEGERDDIRERVLDEVLVGMEKTVKIDYSGTYDVLRTMVEGMKTRTEPK